VVFFQSYNSSIQISHEVPDQGDIADGLKYQLLVQLIFQKTFQIPEARLQIVVCQFLPSRIPPFT